MNGRRLHTLLKGLAIGLALTVAPVFAQGPRAGGPAGPGGPEGQGPRIEDMKDRLVKGLQNRADLTEEQSKAVSAILDETAKSSKDLATQIQALHEKMKANHEAATEKIKAQLTDEQKKKVADMPFFGGTPAGPAGPGNVGDRPRQFAGQEGPQGQVPRLLPTPEEHLERVINRLDLTDDQKAQTEQIFKDGQEKIKAAREDTKTKFRAVLTEDQAKQLDEMEARRDEAVERWRERPPVEEGQRPALRRQGKQGGEQGARQPRGQGQDDRPRRNRPNADQDNPQ
ncbi:MAG: hypothetical protein V2A74_05295 [bacterium]